MTFTFYAREVISSFEDARIATRVGGGGGGGGGRQGEESGLATSCTFYSQSPPPPRHFGSRLFALFLLQNIAECGESSLSFPQFLSLWVSCFPLFFQFYYKV